MPTGNMPDSHAGSPNNDEWFIIQAGHESGPYTLGVLIEKAVVGMLRADDLVKQKGGLWTKARQNAFLNQEFPLASANEAERASSPPITARFVALCLCTLVAIAVFVLIGWMEFGSEQQSKNDGKTKAEFVENRRIAELASILAELIQDRIGTEFIPGNFPQILFVVREYETAFNGRDGIPGADGGCIGLLARGFRHLDFWLFKVCLNDWFSGVSRIALAGQRNLSVVSGRLICFGVLRIQPDRFVIVLDRILKSFH